MIVGKRVRNSQHEGVVLHVEKGEYDFVALVQEDDGKLCRVALTVGCKVVESHPVNMPSAGPGRR